MYKIVPVPNPILRTPTQPVMQLDKNILQIIEGMRQTLLAAKHPEGVGLAAPQVGISLRIFLMRPLPDKKIYIFINPEILKYSQALSSPSGKNGIYEGCLSLPSHYAPVTRSKSITVKYQTLEKAQFVPDKRAQAGPRSIDFGSPSTHSGSNELSLVDKTEVFTGFPAHIIQHEVDHLNGVIFIDRVLEQNTKLYKVTGNTWHEISI